MYDSVFITEDQQILYDTRTPQRLLDEYKNNVVYEYECTNNKETVIQGNKVVLIKMIKNRFYLERK